MAQKKTSIMFKIIKEIVYLFYPKTASFGTENIPNEPCVFVGNHSKMNGPIVCELYFPVPRYTWCAGQMMELKEVPAYAFEDFWSKKPKYIQWFYRILSYIIAPLSVCVFNNANTIGVYRDLRISSTFKKTVATLQENISVVVFPEHRVPHNHIINEFQDKFIDVAKLYYKRSGKEICFVPFYLAPNLHQMHFGAPIRFDSQAPMEAQRQTICTHLMDEISRIACALPEHIVVPYDNLPKKQYHTNKVNTHEETCY